MNYNKLWKLLIDKNMKKKDLREATGLTTNTIAKMGKGGDVSTQVLRKICEALDCKIEDIVTIVPICPFFTLKWDDSTPGLIVAHRLRISHHSLPKPQIFQMGLVKDHLRYR